MDRRTSLLYGLALALVFMACGCSTHALARQMVAPPNNRFHVHRTAATSPAMPASGEQQLVIPVGPPTAAMACWVIEPRTLPARGTIVVLHGFLANHNFVRDAADAFSAAGYRAILVDLRGHGESTGEHITFGVNESHDLVQLTDYLQAHHLAGEHIGVYGTSLGAAVAIQYAAIDRRVCSVVAVASFTNLKDETPHFARTMLPLPGLFLSEKEYASVVHDAGEIANFDPESASPLAAITRTHAKILLIHGDLDNVIPVEQSRRLAAAAPDNTELMILSGHGHLAACFDMTGHVERLARTFFDDHLAAPAPVSQLTPAGNPGRSPRRASR